MNKSLTFKPYEQGDESHIFELFQICFNKQLSPEYWTWRYLQNPSDQAMIELCWDKDLLVSHYSVSPTKIIIDGQEYFAAHGHTGMTHPDYRGRRLSLIIANRMFERLSQRGYKAVWGYPNYKNHFGHVHHLKWLDIHEIPMFHLEMSNLRSFPKVSTNVKTVHQPNSQFDGFWNKVKNDQKVIISRDQSYLNWRYSKHPVFRYNFLGYYLDDTLYGYLVYKRYQTEFDIVDILTVQDDDIGESLVASVIEICRQENFTGINMWLPIRVTLHLRLEKIGFLITEPVTYFGGRLLQPLDDEKSFDDVRSWYYTMSDSDVY